MARQHSPYQYNKEVVSKCARRLEAPFKGEKSNLRSRICISHFISLIFKITIELKFNNNNNFKFNDNFKNYIT